jgi:hypothetical protein
MYALYTRNLENTRWRYRYQQSVSLFGCKKGHIPLLLKRSLPSGQNEPHTWHIDISTALSDAGTEKGTLLINLKPRQRQSNVSLYELLEIWGYSSSGWTPVMMRLRGLFVDDDPQSVDPDDFLYDMAQACDPIFSVMYLAGGISDGSLTGRWTAPGPSSTNGVLMWPDVMRYFTVEADRVIKLSRDEIA